MSPVWRQGHQVPRNIYKDDEPVAMLATEELAAEIVAGMNAAEPEEADVVIPPEHQPLGPIDIFQCRCGWKNQRPIYAGTEFGRRDHRRHVREVTGQ